MQKRVKNQNTLTKFHIEHFVPGRKGMVLPVSNILLAESNLFQ